MQKFVGRDKNGEKHVVEFIEGGWKFITCRCGETIANGDAAAAQAHIEMMKNHKDVARCEYCNVEGCHWSNHEGARADVREWKNEYAAMMDVWG